MSSRPAIPAALRRQVLLEAGHRCAIPGCQHPALDVHHIIPWERCKEHSFDNLIALCPNCHRRADSGEIDAISLRSYKTRLAGLWATGVAPTLETVDSARPWTTATFKDQQTKEPGFDIAYDYPVFLSNAFEHAAEFNALVLAVVLRDVHSMREDSLRTPLSTLPGERWPWPDVSDLAGSFQVMLCTPDLVSVRLPVYRYGAGAAHPGHFTHCLSFQATPGFQLSLRHLFRELSSALLSLSGICAETLRVEDPHVFAEGLSPAPANFERFNLTPEGLSLTFAEYQVGPYTAGEPTVLIPWPRLVELLEPCSAVRRLAEQSP